MKEVKVKEEKRERETKERDDTDGTRKRDKEKERRREKRPSSPPADTFEGDLSSVSNSSNGSLHPAADLVIVDDLRGEFEAFSITIVKLISLFYLTETKRRKVEVQTSKVSISV